MDSEFAKNQRKKWSWFLTNFQIHILLILLVACRKCLKEGKIDKFLWTDTGYAENLLIEFPSLLGRFQSKDTILLRYQVRCDVQTLQNRLARKPLEHAGQHRQERFGRRSADCTGGVHYPCHHWIFLAEEWGYSSLENLKYSSCRYYQLWIFSAKLTGCARYQCRHWPGYF